MAYDNTKLDAAVSRWIKRDCHDTGPESFGETYAGDLLASFENFCADTGTLKRSPGRVALGKALGRREYEKRKIAGLTYWAGITLRSAPGLLRPRENAKAGDTQRAQKQRDRAAERQKKLEEKEAARKARAEKVKKRMAKDSKKANQEAGKLEPAPEAD